MPLEVFHLFFVNLFLICKIGEIYMEYWIQNLKEKYDIKHLVVANFAEKNFQVYKGLDFLGSKLIDTVFGDINSAKIFHERITETESPCYWKQGPAVCCGCKLNENIFVGYAYIDNRDAVEFFNFNMSVLKYLKTLPIKDL